ncbi:MAG: RimK family alpha-L-glutamate ligase [Deltaproteobacteria bacterium]|nr:RimK family alpha-L-glutamate ligase [Deltaproteobacteria bacterium]
MHIGILTARGPEYHPNRRLVEAGSKLGHRVSLIHPKNCLSAIGSGKPGLEIAVSGDQPDVLLPRIGATINDYALTLVCHFEFAGVRVVNGFQSILLARNKFLTLQTLANHGIPVPDSHFVSNLRNFERAVSKLGGYPVVAKTPNSRQGKGVILVESSIIATFIMDNLPTKIQGLLVQEFIPACGREDIRAFVLGDKVIGAMALKPKEGDFRSNVHQNGSAKGMNLNKELTELAIESARALGLEISGTDIIVDANGAPRVIEVNYSPGFEGLEAATGLDIASGIIRYVTQTGGGTS